MASALERRPGPMPGLPRLRLWEAPLSPLLVLSIGWACATAPAVPYTLDTSPLAFLPAAGTGIDDQRGRLHRFADEPGGTGEPVHLGPAQLKLRVAVVAGLGAECFAGLVSAFQFASAGTQFFHRGRPRTRAWRGFRPASDPEGAMVEFGG